MWVLLFLPWEESSFSLSWSLACPGKLSTKRFKNSTVNFIIWSQAGQYDQSSAACKVLGLEIRARFSLEMSPFRLWGIWKAKREGSWFLRPEIINPYVVVCHNLTEKCCPSQQVSVLGNRFPESVVIEVKTPTVSLRVTSSSGFSVLDAAQPNLHKLWGICLKWVPQSLLCAGNQT